MIQKRLLTCGRFAESPRKIVEFTCNLVRLVANWQHGGELWHISIWRAHPRPSVCRDNRTERTIKAANADETCLQVRALFPATVRAATSGGCMQLWRATYSLWCQTRCIRNLSSFFPFHHTLDRKKVQIPSACETAAAWSSRERWSF